jgi:CheY-like chemotaxis protein
VTVEKPFVLIVDDNEATITLVTALLRRDYAIDAATDGSDAIGKLKTKRYAAILLDLRMPHMDGFVVLDFLRDHHPAALRRVLVVTAALEPETIERAVAYGVCAVIGKPFEIEQLLMEVRNCAGPDDAGSLRNILSSGVILLIADMLKSRLV